MEIIVEGHKIDTKDIWDIKTSSIRNFAGFEIHLIDRKPIYIGEKYSYNTFGFKIKELRHTYDRLMKSVKEKWESDKTDLQIFKA